ncbi:MAG: DUF4838 domain-containing protein [Lentisphaeria bacterium]|nr:DUF4838 domain-containing protein [Lentisphaeria bacterium]
MKKFLILATLCSVAAVFAAVPEYLVVGKDLSKFEKVAVQEINEFYSKIYGKKLKTIAAKDAANKSVIYLGQTDFALKNGADYTKARQEEWILKTVGDDLIITGGRPVGTLYGVYTLLEKLGVSFVHMDNTAIPANKPDFPKFNEKKMPAFEGRQIYDDFARTIRIGAYDKSVLAKYNRWLLRSRINGYQYPYCVPDYIGGIYNISHSYKCHSLSHYVNPNLFEKHPEYFSMNELGKRFKPKNFSFSGGLCMSNKKVWEITLNSLREMIKKDRARFPKDEWPYVYDISTLDASPYICKCPECVAISTEEGSEAGLLFRYINYVATEIKKEYPEIIIRTFGYGPTRNVSKKTMPAENVLVFLCDQFTGSDPFRPLTSPVNKSRMPYFDSWKNTGAKFMIWDYWNISCQGNYYNPPRVETIFDAIKPDLKYFKNFGSIALFLEAERDPHAPQPFIELNYFLSNRLMNNLDEDPEKIADIFFPAYYGPAAPQMRKLFEEIRAGVKPYPKMQTTMVVAAWPFITKKFMLDSYLMLKKAEESLPVNSVYRRHVRHERNAFVWAILANWPSYDKTFAAKGIKRDALLKECQSLVNDYINRYPRKKGKFLEDKFEKRFKMVKLDLPKPEKFKNVPEENFRMIAYPHFRPVGIYNSKIVDDADSTVGKAVKSANPEPAFHGVDKILPIKGVRFSSTRFQLGNHKMPGRIYTILKTVPQDEKYHWYKLNGKISLLPKSYFWAHGWAIQANTSHWYTLSDGDPRDNTWDEVWVSAKFTGPAYVKGSKKDNAIWVDMVVATRKDVK